MLFYNKYASLTKPQPIFTVIVPAAGCGRRMGNIYKPLSDICGKPMIVYCLEAFQQSAFVKQIAVSAPRERVDDIQAVCDAYRITKVKCVAAGGETRTESVANAFKAVFAEKEDITPFVAVHDAARPMITERMINDVFFMCVRVGGATAATKVRDAVKSCKVNGVIVDDVDREPLWLMQTPQCFDTDIFHTALSHALENQITAVDDNAVVTGAGFTVRCVETGFVNFKVTYPDDLKLAEMILRERG